MLHRCMTHFARMQLVDLLAEAGPDAVIDIDNALCRESLQVIGPPSELAATAQHCGSHHCACQVPVHCRATLLRFVSTAVLVNPECCMYLHFQLPGTCWKGNNGIILSNWAAYNMSFSR